jgi:uncharacterized spore protein YtfJ
MKKLLIVVTALTFVFGVGVAFSSKDVKLVKVAQNAPGGGGGGGSVIELG